MFAAMAVICLLHARGLGRPAGPTIAVFAVAVAGLVAAAVASARGTVDPVTSVLFAVRPVEYWIAFPAALLLLRATQGRWLRRIDTLLVIVTVLQSVFAILQYYFGLQVGFSHASYERAAGLTVGPYELGAISAALTVYWVSRGRFAMASLAAIALAASISRVSLLGAGTALAILTVFWIVRQARRIAQIGVRAAFRIPIGQRIRAVGQAVSVAAAVLVLAFTLGIIHLPVPAPAAVAAPPAPAPTASRTTEPTKTPEPTTEVTTPPAAVTGPQPPADSITTRLEGTSILGSWSVAERLAEAVPHVRTSAEYVDVAYAHLNAYVTAESAAAAGAEPSNLVRFFRWHLILNTIDDPVDVLLGLGPSFTGPSVDGSYLRMYSDAGLLGLLAWAALILFWFRRTPLWMCCITISLLVGALFIDILYSQRPMVLYWLLLAIAVSRQAAPALPRGRRRADAPAARSRAESDDPIGAPADA